MGIRIYTLYSAAAAAAALATVQILAKGQITGISWGMYAAVGNGQASEVSSSAARQFATNNAQGILGIAICSVAAAATSIISANQFIAIAPGCRCNVGDIIYLHGTQLGAGGTITQTIQIFVQED